MDEIVLGELCAVPLIVATEGYTMNNIVPELGNPGLFAAIAEGLRGVGGCCAAPVGPAGREAVDARLA